MMWMTISSKKTLAVMLVIVSSLLTLTLYKMQTLANYFICHLEPGTGGAMKGSQFQAAGETDKMEKLWTPIEAPLLLTHGEQVAASNILHQMLIKDPITYVCNKTLYIRNRKEGAWKFCDDQKFAIKKPCLVYSFGINYDFTFDDAMGSAGCEVFSFDPSMNTSDHQRNPQVTFFQIGLGGEDTDRYVPKLDSFVRVKTVWRMRTLKTLLEELNHSSRTIDLLKIDIEGSEWSVVRNMLQTGVLKQVRQFLLEWHIFPAHPAKKSFQQLINILKDLNAAGFREFDRNPHPVSLNWNRFNLQSDIGYVNVKL